MYIPLHSLHRLLANVPTLNFWSTKVLKNNDFGKENRKALCWGKDELNFMVFILVILYKSHRLRFLYFLLTGIDNLSCLLSWSHLA